MSSLAHHIDVRSFDPRPTVAVRETDPTALGWVVHARVVAWPAFRGLGQPLEVDDDSTVAKNDCGQRVALRL
eukprot:CAMPEP_0206169086 /NCGR_PEP_ID=MMETSP1474-20131121/34502_1 /ASSEMBLY_ACC=CAM_ASM_001110 /TAXON_ID=97495 /ORGANISM="Imantonia sp., Strain RCC918" /LENGTH=71 /DNA_ID=CAMNT_0053574873 /DNA_START=150 /DNA_END=362 /DNA_ORIENTATION=+